MLPWGSTFHSRLRWAREAAGLNGRELAERIGMIGGSATQSRVSEWERGRIPRPGTQAHIARALGQPVAWLRSGEGAPSRPDLPGAHTTAPPAGDAPAAQPAATRADVLALDARITTIERWTAVVDTERDAAYAVERPTDEADTDTDTGPTAVRALEVERSIARAMIQAGEEERRRRSLELVGLPAQRVDRLLDALTRIAQGGRAPTS